MIVTRVVLRLFAGVLLLMALAGAPSVASASPLPASGVVVAEGVSGHGFIRYWKSFANRADRVVLVVALVAAAALFIITRGKWLK
jgi:hypothetical protein